MTARCRLQFNTELQVGCLLLQAQHIIEKAAAANALVAYTLVEPKIIKAVCLACQLHGVRYVDLWTNLLDEMELHLETARAGVPGTRLQRQAVLSPDYYRCGRGVQAILGQYVVIMCSWVSHPQAISSSTAKPQVLVVDDIATKYILVSFMKRNFIFRASG